MQISRSRPLVALCVIVCGYSVIAYKKRSVKTRQVFGLATYSGGDMPFPYKTMNDVNYQSDCLVDCVTNVSCVAVDYVNRTCQFYNDLPIAHTNVTTNNSLVAVRDLLALIVSETDAWYSYLFPESQHACASLGLSLANQSELQAFYEAGFDCCSCGWIADGSAWLFTQTPREGCRSTVGLSVCDWRTDYNAWCSLA